MIPPGLSISRLGILRNDALGDTLLVLPVATAAKQYNRSMEVELICGEAFKGLLEEHPDLDEVVVDPGGDAGALARVLKDRKYDALLVLRPTPRNAWAAYRARVPLRIGTAFRTYGILFNVRWYGHRKNNELHEIEYNLKLLERLIRTSTGNPQYYLPPPRDDDDSAHKLLEEAGIRLNAPLVAIHPGNRRRPDGTYSSLPWPAHNYATAAELLLKEGNQVIVTGSIEEADVTDVVTAVEGTRDLTGRTSLGQLAWILKECDSMISNSTGVLHLAVAVGTKVIGIYPAASSNSPVRWGPFGPGNKVFTAPLDECPEKRCTGEKCPEFNCLEKVLPADVLSVARGIIAQSPLRARWEDSKQDIVSES